MTATRRVAVPGEVSRLDLLDRVDYQDALAATVLPGVLDRHTPERLTELVMTRAPRWLMHVLVPVVVHRWILGLRLDPAAPAPGPRGWRQLAGFPDAVVFGARGPCFTFRMIIMKAPEDLLIVTLVRFERAAARPVWALVKLGHRAVVRYLVSLGARLAVTEDGAPGPHQ